MAGDTDVSDEAVRRATGRGWDEWFAVLDAYGLDLDHRARAARLASEHPDLPGWWCQMVTVQFERARGLRAVNETTSGFQLSVQKTLPTDPDGAWRALTAPGSPWLPGADWREGASFETDGARVEVRIVQPGRQLRFWWHDDAGRSTVIVALAPSGAKTAIRIQHEGLPSADAVEAYRARWREALGSVAAPPS